MGVGYAATPGIWSKEQVEGWKSITSSVHEAGGRIFLQLWHVGRISHPMFLEGALPVAPSAIAPKGHVSLVRPETPFVTPRALEESELPGIVAAYRRGAENAEAAGFDGVEIHGANGYLLDQFLQDSTNIRRDSYGGSIENRARLMLEVADAVISVWGSGRVGMHLAPRGDSHHMGDSDPLATFSYVARELGRRKLAFIMAREHTGEGRIGPALKQAFGGAYIANEGFDKAKAEAVLAAGEADAVGFGKLFIANPDLPRRFAEDAALNTPDPKGFYRGGAEGYVDYPDLDQAAAA
jgi:2,4-dienoyl-CoA reductase-like NADH-dependent reductase (Old Yellow Enzyme family)